MMNQDRLFQNRKLQLMRTAEATTPGRLRFIAIQSLTLDDAAEGAYWDIVRYAKKLYFSRMTRDTAAIVANAITYQGTLKLATDVEFSDGSFADAWSAAHPDQPRLSRPVDIG